MKIIYATSSFGHNGGGISSIAEDYAFIYNKEHEIIVFTGDDYKKTKTDNFDLFNVLWTDLTKVNAKKLIALINEIKPDIIINSSALLLSLVTPYLNNNIKIISISHFVNGNMAHIAGFNSNYLDVVITGSHYGSKYIENEFRIINKNKVRCIYNFMISKPDSFDILSKKQETNELIIVYPGGSSMAKSPDLVFKIASNLLKTDLKFKFFWLGNTTISMARYSPKIKSIEQMFPKDERLIFTNNISRAESQKIIESANVFLLPSRGEGCPISLLEAMRVGTIPIVSDSHHASRELIADGINGFVIPIKQSDEYIKRIEDIINHHSIYHHIYNNSIQYFLNNLNVGVWKNKMDNLFIENNEHVQRFSKFDNLHFWTRKIAISYLLKKDRIRMIIMSVKFHFFYRWQAYKRKIAKKNQNK